MLRKDLIVKKAILIYYYSNIIVKKKKVKNKVNKGIIANRKDLLFFL
jgi:hypothetical protein